MSTGFECEILQIKGCARPGWYYVLQNGDCPVGAWDWREYSTCYGPFQTQESAKNHLRFNHANPGGHTLDDCYEPDDVMARLLEKATL